MIRHTQIRSSAPAASQSTAETNYLVQLVERVQEEVDRTLGSVTLLPPRSSARAVTLRFADLPKVLDGDSHDAIRAVDPRAITTRTAETEDEGFILEVVIKPPTQLKPWQRWSCLELLLQLILLSVMGYALFHLTK